MTNADQEMGELLARIVKQCVTEGSTVDLHGIGTFHEDGDSGLRFIAETAPSIFIAYVQEDVDHALRLHEDLAAAGLRPWIDKRRLMPGQNWQRAIQRAIECSDFFIGCFSERAVRKRGQFPHELRLALRCADRMPLDDNYLIPVRFEPCDIPRRIQSAVQHVDLFRDWTAGVERLAAAVWTEFGKRMNRY